MLAPATQSRLKNLDALFEQAPSTSPSIKEDSLASMPAAMPQRIHMDIEIDKLIPFHHHPFRLYTGERMEDMVESIRANGILVPIIVRPSGEAMEILSGHNRVHAAKRVGLSMIPAIVMKNLSDEDAWIYVVQTNLIQRSFTDMAHSEKAAVIAMHHSQMFSQGKRNDIQNLLQELEKSLNTGLNGTLDQVGQKLRTHEKLAEVYSLSRTSIVRYLRINQLIPALKKRLDEGDIALIPSVTLSYLPAKAQHAIHMCLDLNDFALDMRKADALREYAQRDELSDETIYLILSGELGRSSSRPTSPTIRFRRKVYDRYFTPKQPIHEVQNIVEAALEYYFAHKKEEEE